VATGRLVSDAPGVGRIGRMAVDRSVRGGRWGRMVLESLMDAARDRGDKEIVLHAQRHAEAFYLRAGFTPVGEPYEEAGIPHITMCKCFDTSVLIACNALYKRSSPI
jgi:predicted GNAT family N-acyltransferase